MTGKFVVLGGSSHPSLTQHICDHLGCPPGKILLGKFSCGETRVEVQESVRARDVYIIQSGAGAVNDNLMELLITVHACKIASASKVTAVLPYFPYSRQTETPHNKRGAPVNKISNPHLKPALSYPNTTDSAPQTPHPDQPKSQGLTEGFDFAKNKAFTRVYINEPGPIARGLAKDSANHVNGYSSSDGAAPSPDTKKVGIWNDKHIAERDVISTSNPNVNGKGEVVGVFEPQPGYKTWVFRAGTLIANLLEKAAGADHVITMDLHDPQYQGYFDVPVDNLYGQPLLKKFIQYHIPDYRNAVIVSPDAGGAKRATAIADQFGIPFALIHKERRPIKYSDNQQASMMLVGEVRDKTVILVDDMADTANTLMRAARLLKRQGATQVYALITHGVLSGEAIDRVNKSEIDKLVVTNTAPQEEHVKRCKKLHVLNVGSVFAEAIRRVHHGESISVLFDYDGGDNLN